MPGSSRGPDQAVISGDRCACDAVPRDEALALVQSVADRVSFDVNPRTVLYVGCSTAPMVDALRERGIAAVGLHDPRQVGRHQPEDVESAALPPPSLPTRNGGPRRQYDLVIALGTFDGISEPDARSAIGRICELTGDVVFSPTDLHGREDALFTLRPPEYWVRLFDEFGFTHALDLDPTFLGPLALRFQARRGPIRHLISSYERHLWSLGNEHRRSRSQALETKDQLIAEQHMTRELRLLVEKREAQVESLGAVAAEREATIGELSARNEDQRLTINNLHLLVAKRDTQIESLHGAIAQREEVIGDLSAARDRALLDAKTAQRDLVSARNDLAAAERRLAEITSSSAWRLVMLAWRVRALAIPPASRRARALRRLVDAARSLRPGT